MSSFHRQSISSYRVSQINLGDVADFKVADKTIVAWLKRSRYDLDGTVFTSGTPHYYWQLNATAPDVVHEFRWRNGACGDVITSSPVALTLDSRWVMWAWTVSVNVDDDVTNKLYADGRLIFQDTQAGVGYCDTYGAAFEMLTVFAGCCAGMAFYNQALTQAELLDLWSYKRRPQDLSGCVSFWPFTEMSFNIGDTVTDIVSGHNGTVAAAGAAVSPHVPIQPRLVV